MINYLIKKMSEEVILKCFKEKSKLRIRIISKGYYNNANCQFPKNIRKEGCYYSIKPYNIKLVTRTNKWFYNIKNSDIKILDNFNYEDLIDNNNIKDNVVIYEDENNNECCICFENEKNSVFIPCGHYYCCMSCSKQIKKCPICRNSIFNFVNKNEFD